MLPFLADTSGNDNSERTSACSSSDNARHRRCSRHPAEEHRPWSSIASGGRLRLNNVEVIPCLVGHPRFLACLGLATSTRRRLAADSLHPLYGGRPAQRSGSRSGFCVQQPDAVVARTSQNTKNRTTTRYRREASQRIISGAIRGTLRQDQEVSGPAAPDRLLAAPAVFA